MCKRITLPAMCVMMHRNRTLLGVGHKGHLSLEVMDMLQQPGAHAPVLGAVLAEGDGALVGGIAAGEPCAAQLGVQGVAVAGVVALDIHGGGVLVVLQDASTIESQVHPEGSRCGEKCRQGREMRESPTHQHHIHKSVYASCSSRWLQCRVLAKTPAEDQHSNKPPQVAAQVPSWHTMC